MSGEYAHPELLVSWFELKYLLGVHNVKNYDGSWTGPECEMPMMIEMYWIHAR